MSYRDTTNIIETNAEGTSFAVTAAYEYGTKGTKTYIRGAGGEIVKTKDSKNNNRYFSYNAHGDTTNIIEKNAESTSFAVTAAYEYDAFGGLVSGTGGGEADSNAFRYNGQYTDEETGLIYLRNRYYDPSIGRFTQEDPYWNPGNMIYGDSGNNNIPSYESISQSANLYVYCASDPINSVDPFGTNSWDDFSRVNSKYGLWTAISANDYAQRALNMAENYSYSHGMGGNTWNNEADAYRHFMWNAMMTRHIGYYEAKFISNVHEYNTMADNGWLDDSTRFSTVDSGWIYGSMNQETLMDLWNNQVGRELANNSDFSWMNGDQLFNYAMENNLLITDADNVFDYLGITYLVADANEYTVNVAWNIDTGNVIVYYYDEPAVTLKIGV